MRRAPNRDRGEPEIVNALRSVGATVQQLDATGVPDLLVGFRGKNWLMEVKDSIGPNGGAARDGQKLSAVQLRWHRLWGGQVCTVRSVGDALAVVGCALVDEELQQGRS